MGVIHFSSPLTIKLSIIDCALLVKSPNCKRKTDPNKNKWQHRALKLKIWHRSSWPCTTRHTFKPVLISVMPNQINHQRQQMDNPYTLSTQGLLLNSTYTTVDEMYIRRAQIFYID